MRLPLTLWRSIFLEILRLTALTAGVLVCVVSFGVTLKYLVDGRLEPGDALKFMLLSIPPFLAYILPFAGGFGSTLTFHRMATDNEMQAAHAGGVSLRSLLIPTAALAAILGVSLVYLNQVAIPQFLKAGQRMVTLEAPRLITTEVQRGRAVRLDRMMVYADGALRSDADQQDPASGVRDHVGLTHMAAMQLDAEGRVEREFFANRADLWFLTDRATQQAGLQEGISLVLVRLKNSVTTSASEGNSAGFKDEATYPWSVPAVLKDKVAYQGWSDMRRLRTEPERMESVDARRRDLAFLIARDATIKNITDSLKNSGSVTLHDALDKGAQLRAGGLVREGEAWRIVPRDSGLIELEVARARPGEPQATSGDQRTMLVAKEGTLRLENEPGAGGGRLAIAVTLVGVQTRLVGAGGERVGGERPYVVQELSLPDHPERRYLSMGSFTLLNEVAPGSGENVARSATGLQQSIKRLMAEVVAKQHERWALALSSVIMVVTGALTALRFAHSQPLWVYLWTFVPALGCMVTISGGQQTASDIGVPGLALLWLGVVGLIVYTLVMYRSVAKH